MERFNYRSIAAAEAESARILYLMECASWGYEMDRKEQAEIDQDEIDRQRHEMEVNRG
jgi:hypothetical protein